MRLLEALRSFGSLATPEQKRSLLEKNGAVFIVSHLGNWELHSQLAPLSFGCKTGTIYQRLGNRLIGAAGERGQEREEHDGSGSADDRGHETSW